MSARKPKTAPVDLVKKRIQVQQDRVLQVAGLLEVLHEAVAALRPIGSGTPNLDAAVSGIQTLTDEIFLALDTDALFEAPRETQP